MLTRFPLRRAILILAAALVIPGLSRAQNINVTPAAQSAASLLPMLPVPMMATALFEIVTVVHLP